MYRCLSNQSVPEVELLQEEEIVQPKMDLDGANIASRLLVRWLSPIIFLGNKRRLEPEDLDKYLPIDLDCTRNGRKMEEKWTTLIRTLHFLLKRDFGWTFLSVTVLTGSSLGIPFAIHGYFVDLVK